MKFLSSLSLLSLSVLVGCSSLKNDHYEYVAISGLDQKTFKEWSQPFSHEFERTPSSEIVGRPRYYWEADSLKIPVTAGATINQRYNVKFNHYSTYEIKVKVPKTVSEVEQRWEQGQNSVLICDTQEGVGKSALWNAFYSAPASKKEAALNKAIEGVGEVSAKNLIRNRYFQEKPRSWSEFEQEVRRAQERGVITKSVEYQILYKYRLENMTKLGYNTQLSSSCRVEIQTYYFPRDVIVQRQVLVEELRTQRDLISSETKQYQVRISGQKLQPFESEMLVFSFDRDSNQVLLAQAAYTNYSISLDGQLITAQGLSRKNINLPSDVVTYGATLESSNGMASFTAPVNRTYIPKTTNDGYLMMSIEVGSCKKGLFGGCALIKKDEVIQPVVVKVVDSSGLVNHKFNMAPGRKYWVRYWVNMANSPWYSSNVVSGPSSPEL